MTPWSMSRAPGPALEARGSLVRRRVPACGGIGLLGGQDVFGTAMSFGLIVTFVAYVQSFNRPVQQIAVLWTNVQRAIAGGERIFELFDVGPDIQDDPEAVAMPELQG